MQITIKTNVPQVAQEFDRHRERLIKALMRVARTSSKRMAMKLTTQHLSGRGDRSLGMITRQMRRSVHSVEITFDGSTIKGGIAWGEGLPYAITHFGKRGTRQTIKAKDGFLAIPTEFAKTAGGRPRGRPLDPIWGPTFVMQGMIWAFGRGTARRYATPRPIFVLKKQIEVPRRVDPKKDLADWERPKLERDIVKAVGGSIKPSIHVFRGN